MGVGVFESDFDTTGKTFLVSGPLADKDDYDSYAKDCEASGEDPLEYDTWARQEYDDANLNMIEITANALKSLGLDPYSREGFRSSSVPFDKEFSGIGGGRRIDVGWRSWETDFVIGVGPAHSEYKDHISEPDSWPVEIIDEYGRAPTVMHALHHKAIESITDYVRLNLQMNGYECRVRTSGYTSASYKTPESGFENELARLAAEIVAGLKRLDMPAEEAVLDATSDERIEMIKAIDTITSRGEKTWSLSIPVFSKTDGNILYFSPYEEDAQGEALCPEAVAAYMRGIPEVGDLPAIPRNEVTESYFVERQQKMMLHHIYQYMISANEYAQATNAPFNEMFAQIDLFKEMRLTDAETDQVLKQSPSLAKNNDTSFEP